MTPTPAQSGHPAAPAAIPAAAQDPRAADFVQAPWPFYDRARAMGPLVIWRDYGLACAFSHALVGALLRDRRLGREPPGGHPAPPAHLAAFHAVESRSMLEREPPVHSRLRGLVNRAFTSRRIQGMAEPIADLSRRLIEDFSGDSVDLLPAWAERIPVVVICRLMGVPEEMADQLLAWSHDMVAMYQARRDRAVEDRAEAAAAAFSDWARRYVDARRSRPAEDLVSALIAAESDGERLTTEELIATLILLLNAGHEATVNALGNGVKTLLEWGAATGRPPAQLLTPARRAATVEEILRFEPPLHLFTRFVREEVEIAGRRFAPGDRIGLLLGAAGRDPAAYPDPHRFDPDRTGPGHHAFGAGIHFCVGAPLARLEMQVALADLFTRLPGLRLAEPPRWADRYHFRALAALRVTA
ncbi:MAG: cytochrome P450 [Paracoccaceae bacterium]|nr:MAG: cytochrome P450 [Paracoccaceae bacterium]